MEIRQLVFSTKKLMPLIVAGWFAARCGTGGAHHESSDDPNGAPISNSTTGSGSEAGSGSGSDAGTSSDVVITLPQAMTGTKLIALSSAYLIATCQGCASIYLFDPLTGAQLKVLTPKSKIAAHLGNIAVSRDQKLAVGLDLDATNTLHSLALWNLTGAGEPSYAATQTESTADVSALAFSDDSTQLAVSNFGNLTLIDTGAELIQLKEVQDLATTRVQGLVFSPDGSRLLVGADGNVPTYSLYETTRLTVITELDTARIKAKVVRRTSFSPDSTRFLTATGLNGALDIWDGTNGEFVTEIGAATAIVGAAFKTNALVTVATSQAVTMDDVTATPVTTTAAATLEETADDNGFVLSPDRTRAAVLMGGGTKVRIVALP